MGSITGGSKDKGVTGGAKDMGYKSADTGGAKDIGYESVRIVPAPY